MSKFCQVCGKGYQKGNLVCFSNKKSIKRSYPNLRKIKINIDGTDLKVRMCTSCLSSTKRVPVEAKAAV